MRAIYLIPLLLLVACNKPACENHNTVFEKNAPGSDAYDAELVT